VFYFFGGQHVPEEAVVDEFRAFVPAMRKDLRRLSSAPTADDHTQADIELDNTSLAEYLDTRGAGPILRAALGEAYLAEYGLEIEEQSCLNFLLFIHADRRSKFTPFGVFSDERFHLVDGNDGIAQGIAALLPKPIEFGMRLLEVRRLADGRIELTFDNGGSLVSRAHDAAVLAIPFTVLRQVQLDASLEIPPWKHQAIDLLGYGTNAKMMIGFAGRPWTALGSNGSSYSDLTHHQTTWETNPARAGVDRGILTDYSGGDRGLALNPSQVQLEAAQFLGGISIWSILGRRPGRRRIHLAFTGFSLSTGRQTR
jgi:monoamine oxidase